MAGEGLQQNLLGLHDCLRGDDPTTNAQKAHDIVGDIGHACLEDVTEKEIDYCCSLLFAKDTGVVSFLRSAVKYDEYQSAKVELGEVLHSFITKWPHKAVPYSVDIKDACVGLFSRDKYSKVRGVMLTLLIEVVKGAAGSQVAEDLQVSKLIEKFFLELTKPTKHTSTVKREIYHLLGVCADVYPEQMVNYSERLLELYMKTLKSEMTSKTRKPELPIITGCLQGLNHYLVNFSQSADEGAKYSYDIFKASRMAFNKDISHSRYDMPKAGLQLLARHAPQFNQYIMNDYESLYETLKWWSGHHNSEVMKVAMAALEAALTQIAEMLVERAKTGKKEGAAFKFFILKFRSIMDSPESSSREVSLAIQGYGLFAAPCKIFLSTNDVQFMFNEMMQRSNQIFFSQSGVLDEKLTSLPSFLHALASIITQLEEISETFLWSLERLVVVLIENTPKMNKKMHYLVHKSILSVFFAVMPKGPTFRGFISRIVYQSLIRTCSHPVVLVTEENPETSALMEDVAMEEKQKISYKDYLDLWKTLMQSTKVKNFTQEDISLEEQQALTDAIFDELVSSTLKIISRLDLASQKDEGIPEGEELPGTSDGEFRGSADTVTSDPVSGLHASKPKDFVIFINLVDFCRDLLPETKIQLFKRWIFTFGHEVILHSTKFPLVSGFYKLLGVCTQICRSIGYFKPLRTNHQNQRMEIKKEEDSMEVDVDQSEAADLTQREACFMLFSKFTKEVLTRIKQYKDDLLASCLTFILSLPQEIVEAEIKAIVPALKMTLKLGQSYLVLALAGLEALQRWTETLSPHVLQPYYSTILPCLDPYLRTTSSSAAEPDQTMALTSRSVSKKTGKKKIPIKLRKQRNVAKGDISQLAQVQQRCVCLLGSLGGSINHYLVTSTADEVAKEAVAWDAVKHLKFDMPFMDIKPTIYFDAFLPRITEVAMRSSDRQAKVAACELLHSVVIFMVGRGAQKPDAGTKHDCMEALYRRLFPVIITLACDVERVASQLFEPLMFQLIHWFTGNKKYESEETMALLDTLIDGIVDPTDTARRDFCARCIREFLSWSIKQTSKKQMENSPMNIKSLLKRLYSLAHHPSAFKRLGAALAFNSIYAVFREEDSLVDKFTFEVLVNYIDSLALAHRDDKSLGTQEQCRLVLGHLEWIIKVKAKMLSEPNKQRIVPKEWNDATLLVALRWLLRQCGRPHTECRHAAMELVYNLAPCLQKINSVHSFFTALLKESGPEYFIIRFERGRYKLQARSGLVQCQTMASLSDVFTLKSALSWFDIVLCTLDCYTWVFGQNLLNPTQTLIVSGNKGTVLFKVLTHFLTELALEDVMAAVRLFKVKPENLYLTPREMEEYNRAKCTVIVRIMDFLMVLLGPHQKESLKVIPGSFWKTNLWEVIVCCVVNPLSLGFNMADVEVMTKLPEQTQQLLQVINRLPANLTNCLKTALSAHMAPGRACDLASKLPESLSDSGRDHFQQLHLVRGSIQLQRVKLLSSALEHVGNLEDFAVKVFSTVFEGITMREDGHLSLVSLTPSSRQLAVALLDLAFGIGLKSTTVVETMLDKGTVRHAGCRTSSRGVLFYHLFQSCINGHLVAMVKDVVPPLVDHAKAEPSLVGGVLVGILDAVSRDRNMRKKEGPKVLDAIMNEWHHLESWWEGDMATEETKVGALTVLTKAILIDGKVVSDVSQRYFGAVFDMYLKLLVDKKTQLNFKSRVMDLLPFFVTLPEAQVKKLKSQLDRLVADNFPMKSSEFPFGSLQHNDYISALNKILAALEVSGSLMLLELLISIMCREARHSHEDEIQMTLTRFIKRLPMDKHKPAVDVAYKIFVREGSFPDEIRRACLERVCLSMLRIVHKAALTEFFCDHVKEIIAIIETKINKASENVLSTQVTSKICAFELLEVMYSRLPKDEVSSKNSRINAVFCKNSVETGKEMTTVITRLCNMVKSEDCRGEELCSELRRQCHCAAYNALVADICCTQTDLKFYNGFLFSENLAKGQFFLDNLVDCEKLYTFPIEMETPLTRRRRFVSIRNEVRDARSDSTSEAADLGTTSVHYLASQYLADSSLGTDISQFDFGTSAGTMSLGSAERRMSVRRSKSEGQDYQEAVVTVEDDYVEMEMDELNQHECMATMTAMLQHMMRNNITPQVDKGASPVAMPNWMEALHKKMQHHSTSGNIKLFIAKLIINTEDVFRPYAKFWLAPIMQVIVTGLKGSPGINYFVVDLVVTILSWHTVALPEDTASDRGMANRLLEFLMENCHHDTRRVLRNNLDVIKTLVEVWKNRVDVPVRVVYQNFSQPDVKNVSNATGVQMLGVILSNKLAPYRPGCGVDKDRYFQHLAMNMTNEHKVVYAAAAEVVGMALQYLTEHERSDEDQAWRTTYIDNISKMLLSVQVKRPDKLITCVHKMQMHHTAVADRFISNMVFMLPRLHGEYRYLGLEIIASRAPEIDDVFTEMKSKGLIGILTHRDEGAQQVALKLVKSLLPKLKPDDVLYVLPSVSAFTSHPSALCRTIMYDIFMWIYDNYREEESEAGHKIMTTTKESLLTGLSDDDLKNRLTVQNFWSHETRLPTATIDRMVAMLEAMYSPSTESQYLAYATNLLLEMTSKSPDYNRMIYEHPLSECRFEDYHVSSSWRQRHAAMTPLFAATQMSQSQSSTIGSDDGMGDGVVRATQGVAQFTPTQQPGGSRGPYNWLTQSSLDTYSDQNVTLPTAGDTQSSLLFTVGKGPSKQAAFKTYKSPGPGFGKGRLGQGQDKVDGGQALASQGSEILRLKKRFLKEKHSSSVFFAKRQSRLNKLREEMQQEQRARRENVVNMYRKYRTGDLPDIQINYSYVIAPLQALAQRDNQVARLLFGSLFKAIFTEIEKVKTERESREVIAQIGTSLNMMLSNSTQYFPAFIACVLDIALEFPRRLKLEPNNINTACITSQQQPLGIVLLEEMLLMAGEDDEERPAKRARGGASSVTQVSRDTATWIELAQMYKSLGDYDMLQGIFSSKVGCQKITLEAMVAEMRRDYKTALNLYNEGLSKTNWEGSPPTSAELDLWDISRLECCANLTDWSELEQYTTQAIDDKVPPSLSQVWEDTYDQEHYLPLMIRGRLKLLLEGRDQQALMDFVDAAFRVPERKAFLESSHCEELALLYLWQEDYDRARHYASSAMQIFLQEWSSLSSLMTNRRSATLQGLQRLTELQEFLAFMADTNNFSNSGRSVGQLKSWLRRSPDPIMDSTAVWDDIITNRCIYIDHTSSRLEGLPVDVKVEADGGDPWSYHKVLFHLAQADSAQRQQNFPVALKQMWYTLKMVKAGQSEPLQLQWSHTNAAIQTHRVKIAPLDPPKKLRVMLATLEKLCKNNECKRLAADFSLGRQHELLRGEAVAAVANILYWDFSAMTELEDDLRLKVASLVNKSDQNSYEEVVSSLVEEGYQRLKLSVGIADRESSDSPVPDTDGINKAHLAFVQYCDKYLRQLDEDEDNPVNCPSMSSFHVAIVTSLLTAMKNDSIEARQRFPRLLQIVEKYPDTINIFIKKASEVPSWMFLAWVGQLTAVLDKPESPAVQDILLRITETYPQAIVYPFKMSSEGYKFESNPLGRKSKQVKEQLEQMLSHNKLVNAFISALEQFGQPNSIFKDWMTEVLKLLVSKTNQRDRERIKQEYKQMYRDLMDQTLGTDDDLYGSVDDSVSQVPARVNMGKYRKKFAQRFANRIVTLCGKDGSKLLDMSSKSFRDGVTSLSKEMDELVAKALAPPGNLKEYSLWLSEFQANNYDQELELPGQYTGLCKPLPEYHTKISSFDERVLVMSSIRKPKRITIRGNDEREYPYLVKGGEDLRQDQRIEQLFAIMNDVFTQDAACKQRHLELRTYQVVPMTPRVGMIEWMKKTKPLKDFLHDAMTEQETKFLAGSKGPQVDHINWIKGNAKENYTAAYEKYSRSDTIAAFKRREEMVPWNLSRRAYQRLSASSEAYFTLRSNFAVSHALVSICQYIIGIGDRHLSNFMIDMETGQMIGIDFGHAFGSATQFLPIPELMPFRLTRQLRNLMLPLREKGSMEGTMVHALRALRQNSTLLLATMDVFIKEPSLDWQQNAERQRKTAGMKGDDVEVNTQWYPMQKIAYAKKKLEGYNPTYVMRDELALGHKRGPSYKYIERVLMGDRSHDIRARLSECHLTVEEQVACLLNQATDPNILGRVYVGWNSWM